MQHILLAEDEAAARLSLSFALKKHGFKVTAVDNGEKAMNIINQNLLTDDKITALLTDVQMPKLTGLELIGKLLEDKIYIPTIVMTAYGDKEIVVDLMRLGCNEYIDKPFSPAELIKRVEELFTKEGKKTRDENLKVEREAIEKEALLSQVFEYKSNFDKLRAQIDSAVGAYNNIVNIADKNLNVEIAYKMKPLSELGGDFIGAKNTKNGCDIFIADVAGHDMGASYHTVLLKTLFEDENNENIQPAQFFLKLNRQLYDNGKNDRMVTGLFLRINIETMTIEIISAGHPHPILIRDGKTEFIEIKGEVLGLHEESEFVTHTFDVFKGDKLLLFTDGIVELFKINPESGRKEKIGEKSLICSINENLGKNIKDLVENSWYGLMNICSNRCKDDMSLLGICIPEKQTTEIKSVFS